MDIKMPGMSGIECARRLEALLPHLIIVMITGLDDPRTIDLARESGAGRFLPKPFTASHLLKGKGVSSLVAAWSKDGAWVASCASNIPAPSTTS